MSVAPQRLVLGFVLLLCACTSASDGSGELESLQQQIAALSAAVDDLQTDLDTLDGRALYVTQVEVGPVTGCSMESGAGETFFYYPIDLPEGAVLLDSDGPEVGRMVIREPSQGWECGDVAGGNPPIVFESKEGLLARTTDWWALRWE